MKSRSLLLSVAQFTISLSVVLRRASNRSLQSSRFSIRPASSEELSAPVSFFSTSTYVSAERPRDRCPLELPMSVAVVGQLHPPRCYLLAEPRQPAVAVKGPLSMLRFVRTAGISSSAPSTVGWVPRRSRKWVNQEVTLSSGLQPASCPSLAFLRPLISFMTFHDSLYLYSPCSVSTFFTFSINSSPLILS